MSTADRYGLFHTEGNGILHTLPPATHARGTHLGVCHHLKQDTTNAIQQGRLAVHGIPAAATCHQWVHNIYHRKTRSTYHNTASGIPSYGRGYTESLEKYGPMVFSYNLTLCYAVYAVVVCLSVTLRYCIKTAKHRITQIMPHDSPGTLVF